MDVSPPVKSPAARWEWTLVCLLAVNVTWTTLCLGGYRPETMRVTWVFTGATLAVGWVRIIFSSPGSSGRGNPGWWFVPFLGYAALNVMFAAPARWLGWLDWIGWANLIGTFVIVAGLQAAAARRTLFYSLVGIAFVAVGLACYQRFVRPDWLMLGRTQAEQFIGRASGSFGIPNSLAALLLLLLPACGALTLRRGATAVARVWWGWVTLILGLGFALTISRGAWIGLALALGIWPLLKASWSWRRRLKACGAVIVGSGCLAALAIAMSPAIRERFTRLVREDGELSRPVLWRAACKLWSESPWTGTGAGSYNVAFERHRPERFLDEPQWAHNDYLNTLSDYGVLGFALFFGVAGWMAWWAVIESREPLGAHRADTEGAVSREALGVGLLAFGLQLFVDFHLKIPALAMAFAACAGLALPCRRSGAPTEDFGARRGLRLFPWLALVGLFALLWPTERLLRAEALRYRARQTMDQLGLDEGRENALVLSAALDDLRRATELCPDHGGAWADLSFAHQLEAWLAPRRSVTLAPPSEIAARQALARSEAVPEFWLRLGVALDMQGRFGEAQRAFDRALRLAPNRVQAWYYLGYHLSLAPEGIREARQALGRCLALDPGNRAAQSLLRRLNERQ